MLSALIKVQYCYDILVESISTGLLLYSHVPTALVALLFGGFLFYKTKKLSSFYLFLLCLSFAVWCFLDLGTWFVFLGSEVTMFTWSIIDIFSILFFVFSYFFLYTFVKDTDVPRWQKVFGIGLLIPTLFWTITSQNLSEFYFPYCEAVENPFIANYAVYLQSLVLAAVVFFTAREYKREVDRERKHRIALAGFGITLFLFVFLFATFMTNLQLALGIWPDFNSYNISIYGLFGMPVLLIYLGYLIVRYQAFDFKVFTAQALVILLITLSAAQYAFLHGISSLILITGLGVFLARNVKREIQQREQIEVLAQNLEKTNKELEAANAMKARFLSIASHQFRSPLTAIKGYTALLLDGSYGEIPEGAKEPVERILKSSANLGLVVDDFLNLSRIEQGRMEYKFETVDMKDFLQDVVDEQQGVIAQKKNLSLTFYTRGSGPFTASIDRGKLKQVATNLVDNAIKYTPEGVIEVHLERDDTAGVIRFWTKDTGVGIAKETLPKLFEQFVRANNANTVNVMGTGLGLYIAREIVNAHKGRIWADSEGEGKGSQFTVEIPIVKA
jgi:signal transduction histidine kinase